MGGGAVAESRPEAGIPRETPAEVAAVAQVDPAGGAAAIQAKREGFSRRPRQRRRGARRNLPAGINRIEVGHVTVAGFALVEGLRPFKQPAIGTDLRRSEP